MAKTCCSLGKCVDKPKISSTNTSCIAQSSLMTLASGQPWYLKCKLEVRNISVGLLLVGSRGCGDLLMTASVVRALYQLGPHCDCRSQPDAAKLLTLIDAWGNSDSALPAQPSPFRFDYGNDGHVRSMEITGITDLTLRNTVMSVQLHSFVEIAYAT